MKEVVSRTMIEVDMINPHSGEIFKVQGSDEHISTYYSVRNITSRINSMDLFTAMEKTCKSSKDIYIVNTLFDKADSHNEIRLSNITNTAKDLGVSRVKLTTFLKRMVDTNMLHKLDTGIYMINPFMFTGRRVRSNELREAAQVMWDTITLGKCKDTL
jgi:hypothetical protein